MVSVGTDIVIAASGTIVLGGLAAVARSILRTRDRITENTRATVDLTRQMGELSGANGRLARIERLLARLWAHVFPGESPPD